jgi:hypothetical protein
MNFPYFSQFLYRTWDFERTSYRKNSVEEIFSSKLQNDGLNQDGVSNHYFQSQSFLNRFQDVKLF